MLFFKLGVCGVIVLFLCSCSTFNNISGDRKWSNCGMGALGGAAVGAAGGAVIAGKGNRGTGAIIGALLGGLGGCVIADKLGQKDKKEISTVEKQALETGNVAEATWESESGKNRAYSVKTEPVTVESNKATECRKATGTLTDSSDGSQATSEQVYCKSTNGEWETAGAVL